MAIDKFSMFRIISFSLAAGDVVQTIPDTYRLYRKQWVNGNLSAVCFFYACTRYISIISLVSNGIGFFGTNFTPESCKRFYMLPNITAMLASMSVQMLVFIRTLAISGRSKRCFYGLGLLWLICLPFQVFGIVYHRNPFLNNGSCKGRVPVGDTDWNVVYYSAHMAFDLFACITATTYIILISRVQGTFNTSRFLMRVLRNGILYTAVVFLANLWVVLEFTGVFVSGAASTLPLAVMMIAAQHLILSTQRLRIEEVTSLDDIRDSRYNTPNRDERDTGPARFYSSERDEETQPDVYVLSKQKSTQRSSTFDPEDKSGTFDPDSNGSHTLRSKP
ncbi:putative transmembrane protein [Favolaschia claudopus]|uniref:Transmembrane protein n=1 Tax=Favolaschia claudopus TaxID=2862362 RepID=A0AAW0EEE0_9AGAR